MPQPPARVLILFFLSASTLLADVRLEVLAGGHDRNNCPVTFPLPDTLNDTRNFTLVRESDNTIVATQVFGHPKSRKLMWMLETPLKSGGRRTYRLTKRAGRSGRASQAAVQCVDDGSSLTVTVDDAPVLQFNHGMIEAPAGIDSVYRRSGYFHPVSTPQGNVVTGDFEPDHPHQHGIFNAWVNATFRDQPADFWNQAKGKGDVEFTEFKRIHKRGPVFVQFTAKLSHVAVRANKRIPAIDETLIVRVYNSAQPFLFDITSRQTAASVDPVMVNEYHYGGFGIRGPSAWLLPKKRESAPAKSDTAAKHQDPLAVGNFLTSSARTRVDGNHTRARWVDLHGPVGSQHAGIGVLSFPQNFRAPQTVRLHPSKPYFCFAPMVLGKFKIEPGETFSSRYRLVVHDGEPNALELERFWQDLAHPPKVRILAAGS